MSEAGVAAELLEQVRAARRRLAATGPRTVRADGDFERVALPSRDADVLRDLLVADGATTVIEIGLAYGVSALAVAEALVATASTDACHLIIDAYQDHFDGAGWDVLLAAGLAGVCTLVPERSQVALPRLGADGFVADAAFVDGSHIFHNVFVDLSFLREIVRPAGLVILDDCDYPSVATAARYFEVNARWKPEPIEAETRLRAFRLPSPRFEPRFEDFLPFG